ncbi:cytochrome c oxidase assembly protein [Gilvimarinus sp. F26214L]|uniref:cytochrome c oxidase assembly protein n=1 Tax=Gilvimarinus sp. DZF01 TaxID=3461371 RepID=UPI004045FC8E
MAQSSSGPQRVRAEASWHSVAAGPSPRLAFAITLLLPDVAEGHADQPPAPHDLWSAWNIQIWLLVALGASLLLFSVGRRRLQARSRHGASWRLRQTCHGLALVFLFVALISPLDALGEALSSAHMAQHMLLFFAAPLLVLARPVPVYLWALPVRWRRFLVRPFLSPGLGGLWAGLSSPLTVWALYALVLWGWHAPMFYQAALAIPWVHDLEHFSFLFSGLLLWWAVFRPGTRARGMLILFGTMLHSGLLAALMSFSTRPWYPAYVDSTIQWGLTPLQDQQLAGALMWVLGGLGYLFAGLAFLILWLGNLNTRFLDGSTLSELRTEGGKQE